MQSSRNSTKGGIINDLLSHLERADVQVSCEEVDSVGRRRRGGTKELISLSNLSLLVFFLHGRHNDVDNTYGPVLHVSSFPWGCTPVDFEAVGIKDALMIGAAPPGIINLGSREELPTYSKAIREDMKKLVNELLQTHLKKSLNDIEDSIAQKIESTGIDSQISPPSSPRRERSRSPSPDRKHSENPNQKYKLGDRERDTRLGRYIERTRYRYQSGERDTASSRGEHIGFAERIKRACKFCLNFAHKIVFSPTSLLGYVKGATQATSMSSLKSDPIFTACSKNKPNETCELSGDFFVEIACKLREKLKEMDDIRFPFLLTCLDPSCEHSSVVKSAIDTSKNRFGPVKVMKGFGTDIDPICFNKTLYYHPKNDAAYFQTYGATIYTVKKKDKKITFIEKSVSFDEIFPETATREPIGWRLDSHGGKWTTFQGLLGRCRELGLTEHVIAFDGSCSVFRTEQSCVATMGPGIVLGGGDRDKKINRGRAEIYKKIKRTKRTKRTKRANHSNHSNHANHSNRTKQMSRLKKQNKTKKKYIRRHN
jgi:hypothetical protein